MHSARRRFAFVAAAWLAGAAAACDRGTVARAAPVRVDSVVPRDVALARFREGLREPTGLSGGAASREALVGTFVRALERRDSATIAVLALDRAEFAWLYYPTSPEARPPYDLEPGLMWFLLEGRSRQGLTHLLEERGGRPLGYLEHACEGAPRLEGANSVWAPCVVVRLQAPGDTVGERLFGAIVERGGTFKFVSYANSL
jgi:hypothetical protein